MVDLSKIKQAATAEFKKAEDVVAAEEQKIATYAKANWYPLAVACAVGVVLAVALVAIF